MKLSRYNMLFDYIKRHFWSLVPFLTLNKIFNILLAVFEMKRRKIICASRPFMFRIDPCSLCNLRCVSCSAQKKKTSEKGIMDPDDFKKIIDRITKYAIRVSLYDLGEPLLNKNIYEMIQYASGSDNRISTLMSTNFNLFQKNDLEKLFNSNLTVLAPCLDGFTQENYVKYRIRGDVETVKNGIKMVQEYKQKKGLRFPIVDVQIVMFDHIKDEIPLIDNFLKRLNVDRITYRPESLGFNSPETTIKGKSLKNKNTCFWLYLGMIIGPDGSVYPCCGRSNYRVPFGNILKQNLEEIWNNEYYRYARSLFSSMHNEEHSYDTPKIPCISCKEFEKRE